MVLTLAPFASRQFRRFQPEVSSRSRGVCRFPEKLCGMPWRHGLCEKAICFWTA
jgi:hypothetical protein